MKNTFRNTILLSHYTNKNAKSIPVQVVNAVNGEGHITSMNIGLNMMMAKWCCLSSQSISTAIAMPKG